MLPALAASAPDFALLDQSLTVSRKSAGKLVVSISRPGGFSGNVVVSAPSSLPDGVTLSPAQVSTTNTNASFDLTVEKNRVQRGTYNLVFSGKDDAGREKRSTIALTIQ